MIINNGLPLVLIDHNVIVDLIDNKKNNQLITICDFLEENYKFIFTYAHLYENSQYNDTVKVRERARFIDKKIIFKAVWAPTKLYINRLEINNFLKTSYFKEEQYLEHFSFYKTLTELSRASGDNYAIEITTEQLTMDWHYAELSKIQDFISTTTNYSESYKKIQEAKKKGTIPPSLDEKMFIEWIIPLIPERTPKGEEIDINIKKDILEHCRDNTKRLLESCPSIMMQYLFTDYRNGSAYNNRKPKRSDILDLEYVSLIPYIDCFVTKDGLILEFLDRYSRGIILKNVGRYLQTFKLFLPELPKFFKDISGFPPSLSNPN